MLLRDHEASSKHDNEGFSYIQACNPVPDNFSYYSLEKVDLVCRNLKVHTSSETIKENRHDSTAGFC